jgi:hypothetical protein
MPFASPNCTKMRLVCGRNGTWPLAVAKIAKVGVALALIVVVYGAGGEVCANPHPRAILA